MDTRTAQQEDLVRRIFEEGWNRASFEFFADASARSMPFHYNGRTITATPDSLPRAVGEWRRAFPDLEMRIRHLIASDDLVAVALTLRGTQEGEWRGREATGRHVEVEETMFFRFHDGLLVEMWEVFDEAGLEAQLSDETSGARTSDAPVGSGPDAPPDR